MVMVATMISDAVAAPGLYGVDANVAVIQQFLNGSSVEIGKPLPYELQAQQLSALDEAHGVLYLLGYNDSNTQDRPNLVGVNLTTGAVVSDVPMPFVESAFIGVGQQIAWEPNTGRIIAGGQLQANGPHTVGLVDPKTGNYTQVASVPEDYVPVLGGAVTYAPNTNEFLMQWGTPSGAEINIFSVNMATGNWTQWEQSYTNGSNIETMDYDYKTGMVYGLGIEPNGSGIQRTLVRMDPRNMTITPVGVVSAFTIESGGIAALDTEARQLVWIGQQANAPPTAGFYIIEIALADASVTTSAPLCSNDAACPWSLEFLNPRF